MAALYQRSSDNRWIARLRVDGRIRYLSSMDRDDLVARASQIAEDNLEPPKPPGDDRFWSKVQRGPNCWLWRGTLKETGYGQYWDGERRAAAHRFAYELLREPIPDGLTIDHLCRNTWCVNPDHMEPVPMEENLRRRTRSGGYRVPLASRVKP